MRKMLTIAGILVGVLLAGPAVAQNADTTVTVEMTTGFNALSPGNKAIASALYDANLDAQLAAPEGTTVTELSLDDIAAMKQEGMGWGQVFKQLQADGAIGGDVKNLGQLVSSYKHHQHAVMKGGEIIVTNAAGGQVALGRVGPGAKKGPTLAAKGGKRSVGRLSAAEAKGYGTNVAQMTTASGYGGAHGIGKGGGMGKALGQGGKGK